MLKWLKLHKRKIYAFLACLAVITLFAVPCFAYDVTTDTVNFSYSGVTEYISYSSSVIDYINDVSLGDTNEIPALNFPITDNNVVDAFNGGYFYSPIPQLGVSVSLSSRFGGCNSHFAVGAILDADIELGLKLQTDFSPFYLVWDNHNVNPPNENITSFNISVTNSSNNDVVVNNDISLWVSPLGSTQMLKLKFENVGADGITYSDILNNIPSDWDLILNYHNVNMTPYYGLYIHNVVIETHIYSDVEHLAFSDYYVEHNFNYGTDGLYSTDTKGNERYYDILRKPIPIETLTVEVIDGFVYINGVNTGVEATTEPPIVEVIDDYVYVDGVNTGISINGLDDVDWLHITLEWLSNAVDGFLKIEFVPYVTLGTLLIIIVSFSVVMWWLKVFGGG